MARVQASVFRLGSGGTGYVVDPPGAPRGVYLVTNEHVGSRGHRLKGGGDARYFEVCAMPGCLRWQPMTEFDDECRSTPERFGPLAETVAVSKERDLALVRLLDEKARPALPFADLSGGRDHEGFVGSQVSVLGFWDETMPTASLGRVTSVKMTLADLSPGHEAMSRDIPIWFTDAPTCAGSSGSPVLFGCGPKVLGTMFGGHGDPCSEGKAYFVSARVTEDFLKESAGAVAGMERKLAEKGGAAAYALAVKTGLAEAANSGYLEAYILQQAEKGRKLQDDEATRREAAADCPKKKWAKKQP